MSSPDAATGPGPSEAAPALAEGGLRWRQIAGILRLELRKNLLSKRALLLYVLAFGPVMLPALKILIVTVFDQPVETPAELSAIFALMFEVYLRVSIFLAAVFLFMNLFRAEIQERSLHYYLLTPVRREVLVAGKYVSALLATSLTFVLSTTALYLLLLLPAAGDGVAFLTRGPGLGNLTAYLGIAVLACAGYGAVFLLLGLVFRNPVVPAIAVWLWEAIGFVLPPLLKKLSVYFYLQSLYPIPLAEGIFAVFAAPTPAWMSVPGLLLFTAAILVLAGLKARRMEIAYGAD